MKINRVNGLDFALLSEPLVFLEDSLSKKIKYEYYDFFMNLKKSLFFLRVSFTDIKSGNFSVRVIWKDLRENKTLEDMYCIIDKERPDFFIKKFKSWLLGETSELSIIMLKKDLGTYFTITLRHESQRDHFKTPSPKLALNSSINHYYEKIFNNINITFELQEFRIPKTDKFSLEKVLNIKRKQSLFTKSFRYIQENQSQVSLSIDHLFGFRPFFEIKTPVVRWMILSPNKEGFEFGLFFKENDTAFLKDKTSPRDEYFKKEFFSKNLGNFRNDIFNFTTQAILYSNTFDDVSFSMNIEANTFSHMRFAYEEGKLYGFLNITKPVNIKSLRSLFYYKFKPFYISKFLKFDEQESHIIFEEICKMIARKERILSSIFDFIKKDDLDSSYFIISLVKIFNLCFQIQNKNSSSHNDFIDDFFKILWGKDHLSHMSQNNFLLLQKILSKLSFFNISLESTKSFIIYARIKIDDLKLVVNDFIKIRGITKFFSKVFIQPKTKEDLIQYCYLNYGIVLEILFKVFSSKNHIDLYPERFGVAIGLTYIIKNQESLFLNGKPLIPNDLLQKYSMILNEETFSPHSIYREELKLLSRELSDLALMYYSDSYLCLKLIDSLKTRLFLKFHLAKLLSDLKLLQVPKNFLIGIFYTMKFFTISILGFNPLNFFNTK